MPTETAPRPADPARRIDWRRLRRPAAVIALVGSAGAALGQTLGTHVAGLLAEDPTTRLVGVLALCVVGAALLDTVGRYIWSAVVDRAEGRLRGDLLTAALRQPLATLSEQAVGEILDRVDDDTHDVGTLVRLQVWQLMRTVFAVLPMWMLAGFTWWPAFLLFPAVAAVTALVVRPLLAPIASRKVIEEMAWTDHAAALEEGIAGRDDLRTSLGQAYVVRRVAQLSAEVHAKFARVIRLESRLIRRSGLLLHGLLVGVAVTGVALVLADGLTVGRLVTLFLVTTMFVGQISHLAEQLPDLQAGVGAVVRLRQMFASPPEPDGGRDLPEGDLAVELRDLHFAYDEGTFALNGVNLEVPAGTTIALVGRTGSGKSTLAALLSRAVEPEPGSVFLGGVDVGELDLEQLRSAVGVVSQRTDILAGTLAENITLFADRPRAQIEAAVAELGLTAWVQGLPDGLDTELGAGGTTLSAGEEQLVAFARLLVRDVRVVILDEATARMDPLTERRVVAAADRLLRGRTGILIAHRLSTTERAATVAVLEQGRVIQQGPRAELARAEGPFRRLLEASSSAAPAPLTEAPVAVTASDDAMAAEDGSPAPATGGSAGEPHQLGHRRRTGPPPDRADVGTGPSLTRGITSALLVRPAWGVGGAVGFLLTALVGAHGALTGFVWGHLVVAVREHTDVAILIGALVLCLIAAPLLLADAIWRYPRWWVEVLLRTRMSVLRGQTRQRRLPRTPPGEVVARSMDADRYARYADRWVDFINGLVIAAATAAFAGSWLAGGVLLAVMVASALASTVGRPIAGRSAAAASLARAGFGRSLVSALESARTVKLAGATPDVHAHLQRVDSGRVRAAVREHRVQAVLDGVPIVMVQAGVVTAWAAVLWDWWGLATALLVANAVNGFDWFGRVAGSVVTEAPGTRSWQQATSAFAGGVDLMHLPDEIDLLTGAAPPAAPPSRERLEHLELAGVTAVHDDGTIGVLDVNLQVEAGELVLLVGQVGSGKSSLLASLAGLTSHRGEIRWNGRAVADAEMFLRPGQVAHVAQVPRVLSGTFADNIRLDHDRDTVRPVEDARLAEDVASAGGVEALVGHRGVRLSGGQVQRLALARALATDTDLLLADDVSSALDATTELELWAALRERRTTVIGATSKRAALALADRVVVLEDGAVAAVGPWSELEERFAHLAG
ncbi:ABC-type multidrug transport system, ATPase and permease component [Ruania alba]|uniref:ABC-type multidrug transport system, ATPase and permease component n=2 Tax=Ruania alba TaxID=648782 RepID=A0A1H5KFW4_9MICO|nr:ABC transporter ATP-binding protein [Ruania alba]SEE63703.1 ABC-type multidrug transport system, ATPase and permease component [Ruania alba]